MLPAADAVGAEHAHGEEAEGEVEHRQAEVDAQGDPAVLARQLAQALRERGCGGGAAQVGRGVRVGFVRRLGLGGIEAAAGGGGVAEEAGEG